VAHHGRDGGQFRPTIEKNHCEPVPPCVRVQVGHFRLLAQAGEHTAQPVTRQWAALEKLTMINPLIIFALSAALIAAGHWFPWRLMLGRQLRRLEAYTYGVLAILLPVVVALWGAGETGAALLLVAGAVGAGAATLLAYGVDKVIDMRHELLDAKDKAAYDDGLPLDTGD
jgi:hypothetical protein